MADSLRTPKPYFEQIPLDAVRAATAAARAVTDQRDPNVIFEPPSAKTEPYSVQEGLLPRARRLAKVLLVDPDVTTRFMHAEHLRRLTYDVEEAGDGLEALARAVANHLSIIVTESQLTGISGVELCRMLRSEPLTRRVPVIVLAADGGFDAPSARIAGADSVLLKPWTSEDLATEIRALLAHAATRDHETPTDG